MGNRFENFKWVYINADTPYIKVYAYHTKADQDNFLRWSFTDFNTNDKDVITTYKQAVRFLIDNPNSFIDIKRLPSNKIDTIKEYILNNNIEESRIKAST